MVVMESRTGYQPLSDNCELPILIALHKFSCQQSVLLSSYLSLCRFDTVNHGKAKWLVKVPSNLQKISFHNYGMPHLHGLVASVNLCACVWKMIYDNTTLFPQVVYIASVQTFQLGDIRVLTADGFSS